MASSPERLDGAPSPTANAGGLGINDRYQKLKTRCVRPRLGTMHMHLSDIRAL